MLVFMGWISVYGASYDFDHPGIFDFSQRAGKQLLWIACSFLLGASLIMIDNRVYDVFAYFIYAGAIFLLFITIFLAPDIKGSRSWLVFGPVSIQPAELGKFATGLALAKCMSQYNYRLKGFKNYLPVLFIILLPMTLVILQKETGSALVFFAFFLMLYREGMPGVLLYLALCCVVLFIVTIRFGDVYLQGADVGSLGFLLCQLFILITQLGFILVFEKNTKPVLLFLKAYAIIAIAAIGVNFIVVVDYTYFGMFAVVGSVLYLFWLAIRQRRKNFAFIALFTICAMAYCFSADYIFDRVLEPHQETRIKVVLGMEDDPTGAGYNVNQSKIAIGSGQFFGKGFLNGTQTKLKYVPEQDTDFIFCTVGEEHGFWGSVLVLGTYVCLMLRLLVLAERQREPFGRIYGYCVTSVIFFHFAINIGMVLGLAPVIGIPLPFFSYGGSSLWSFTIMLFIFLRLDAARLEQML